MCVLAAADSELGVYSKAHELSVMCSVLHRCALCCSLCLCVRLRFLPCVPARSQWQDIDPQKTGLHVWRIEKFKVVAWPRQKYGKFFNGDSYIVLHTYHKNSGVSAVSAVLCSPPPVCARCLSLSSYLIPYAMPAHTVASTRVASRLPLRKSKGPSSVPVLGGCTRPARLLSWHLSSHECPLTTASAECPWRVLYVQEGFNCTCCGKWGLCCRFDVLGWVHCLYGCTGVGAGRGAIAWDIHFWIGSESTQDEYGTAGVCRCLLRTTRTRRVCCCAPLLCWTLGLMSLVVCVIGGVLVKPNYSGPPLIRNTCGCVRVCVLLFHAPPDNTLAAYKTVRIAGATFT